MDIRFTYPDGTPFRRRYQGAGGVEVRGEAMG